MAQFQISLNDIRLHAFHGCLQQEQRTGNHYLVNLTVTTSVSTTALHSDQLEGTVSYANLYEIVIAEMAIPSQLLEHVCGRITKRLFHSFPTISQVYCSITKIAPPVGGPCASASVSLTTNRDDF